MKKILVFTPHFFPENQILNDLVFSLNKKHHFTIVTSFPNYPSRNFFKNYTVLKHSYSSEFKNIKIIRLPVIYRRGDNKFFLFLNYLSYLISSIFLVPFLLLMRFDRIFIYLTSPFTISLAPLIISFLKKIKLSIWILDLWPETLFSFNFPFKKKLINFFFKFTNFTYSKCDKILISSEGFSKSLSLKKYRNKIYFAPQWIISQSKKKNDLNHFIPKLKKDSFILLFAGNMGHAQNLYSIYKTINLLKKENDIIWFFLGDGSEKNAFKKKLLDNNLKKNIYFFDHIIGGDIDAFYKISNAILIPLLPEIPFNMVLPAKLQTSINYGKPLLTLSNGEVSNFVKKYQLGLTAKSNDYKKLANNILSIKKYDISELNRIKTRCNSIAINIFNKSRILKIIQKQCID